MLMVSCIHNKFAFLIAKLFILEIAKLFNSRFTSNTISKVFVSWRFSITMSQSEMQNGTYKEAICHYPTILENLNYHVALRAMGY